MRIAIISGSARTNNNTLRVAKAIEKLMEVNHRTTVIDFQAYDIPLLAQGGLNPNDLSEFQKKLIKAVEEAHVVIMISPEYNWSTTPEILNMLHYLPNKPFQNIFNHKVFAFVGVSTGKGGKAPALHLMQILHKLIGFGNLDSMVSSKIFESHYTKEVLNDAGESLGNEMYNLGLKDFTDYTLRMAQRWFK
jgi:chromate reductase, NAD(P)H dehydrogenase (quinone)